MAPRTTYIEHSTRKLLPMQAFDIHTYLNNIPKTDIPEHLKSLAFLIKVRPFNLRLRTFPSTKGPGFRVDLFKTGL